jgi:hypothetical protein
MDEKGVFVSMHPDGRYGTALASDGQLEQLHRDIPIEQIAGPSNAYPRPHQHGTGLPPTPFKFVEPYNPTAAGPSYTSHSYYWPVVNNRADSIRAEYYLTESPAGPSTVHHTDRSPIVTHPVDDVDGMQDALDSDESSNETMEDRETPTTPRTMEIKYNAIYRCIQPFCESLSYIR